MARPNSPLRKRRRSQPDNMQTPSKKPRTRPAKKRKAVADDDFVSVARRLGTDVARRLGTDEDRRRFEAMLGKIAKAKPVKQ